MRGALRIWGVANGEWQMPAADRMRAMRERRRMRGMREVRLNLPDARLEAVRRRVAGEVAALIPALSRRHWNGSRRFPSSMTAMKRGDVVVVAAAGDHGKLRPA